MLSFFQAMIGCMRKDLQSAWTEKATILQTITLPVNYLILLSLFALSGSNAPVAVVMKDNGYYAQAFVRAMEQARSFSVRVEPEAQAEQEYQGGTLVGVLVIPANFDAAVITGQAVQLPFSVDNIHQDLTDDAARGMRLATTLFYAQNSPNAVPITVTETDAYASTTGYIPYLSISILVVALLVIGLLQAGMAASREWERATIKELLLAPVSLWAIIAGKILSVFLIGLPALAVVLTLVVAVSGWPVNFPLVIGVSLLSLLCFAAAGCALGMAVKDRANVTTVARAVAVPLLFLSGLFGPIGYSTGAVQVLARSLPVHYSIALEQLAFKAFVSNTLLPWQNTAVITGYALVFVALAFLAVRVSKVEH